MNWTDEWNLASIPHDVFKSEWARRTQSMRKSKRGGNSKTTGLPYQAVKDEIQEIIDRGKQEV